MAEIMDIVMGLEPAGPTATITVSMHERVFGTEYQKTYVLKSTKNLNEKPLIIVFVQDGISLDYFCCLSTFDMDVAIEEFKNYINEYDNWNLEFAKIEPLVMRLNNDTQKLNDVFDNVKQFRELFQLIIEDVVAIKTLLNNYVED